MQLSAKFCCCGFPGWFVFGSSQAFSFGSDCFSQNLRCRLTNLYPVSDLKLIVLVCLFFRNATTKCTSINQLFCDVTQGKTSTPARCWFQPRRRPALYLFPSKFYVGGPTMQKFLQEAVNRGLKYSCFLEIRVLFVLLLSLFIIG